MEKRAVKRWKRKYKLGKFSIGIGKSQGVWDEKTREWEGKVENIFNFELSVCSSSSFSAPAAASSGSCVCMEWLKLLLLLYLRKNFSCTSFIDRYILFSQFFFVFYRFSPVFWYALQQCVMILQFRRTKGIADCIHKHGITYSPAAAVAFAAAGILGMKAFPKHELYCARMSDWGKDSEGTGWVKFVCGAQTSLTQRIKCNWKSNFPHGKFYYCNFYIS